MDNSALSLKLIIELKMQLIERRNKFAVSLLKLLQDPRNLLENDDKFSSSTSKSDILKAAKLIWKDKLILQL